MEYAVIGVIIGFVMGLTGSGGALVAIPLFISLLGFNLKDASIYSLLVVSLASFINFIDQRKFVDYKLAGFIFLGSIIGSFALKPVKLVSSDLIISLLLALISLYALYSVWKKKNITLEVLNKFNLFKTLFLGFILGGLTTMTGLGGGVLLMPIFISFFRMNELRAVGTSLITIALSSLFSLAIQFETIKTAPSIIDFVLLMTGIISSTVILRILVKKISVNKISLTRKIIFSLVVCYAFLKIF